MTIRCTNKGKTHSINKIMSSGISLTYNNRFNNNSRCKTRCKLGTTTRYKTCSHNCSNLKLFNSNFFDQIFKIQWIRTFFWITSSRNSKITSNFMYKCKPNHSSNYSMSTSNCYNCSSSSSSSTLTK